MKKKVRITTISNDHEVRYDTKAIIHDNSIVYIEKDEKKTKTYFNYEKKQLIRENKEISLRCGRIYYDCKKITLMKRKKLQDNY